VVSFGAHGEGTQRDAARFPARAGARLTWQRVTLEAPCSHVVARAVKQSAGSTSLVNNAGIMPCVPVKIIAGDSTKYCRHLVPRFYVELVLPEMYRGSPP